MKHFPNEGTALAPNARAPRGISIAASQSDKFMHVYMHNGCGRGNMRSILSNEDAIKIAIEIIKVATR